MLGLLKMIVIVGTLTLLTQVGGLFYLLYLSVKPFIQKRVKGVLQWTLRVLAFAAIYLFMSLVVLPPVAAYFGRVPLPWSTLDEGPLAPRSFLYSLANRHYVKPELKQLLQDQADKLAESYPEVKVLYLDASFPFYDGYPLFPHLSHDDGEKADIALFYRNNEGTLVPKTPAWIGYGHYEGPREGELDQPALCAEQGYRKYTLFGKYSPTSEPKTLSFADDVTAQFILQLARDDRTGKIFLEPHLKGRLGLEAQSKIRNSGCHAVRHDDHLHVEL